MPSFDSAVAVAVGGGGGKIFLDASCRIAAVIDVWMIWWWWCWWFCWWLWLWCFWWWPLVLLPPLSCLNIPRNLRPVSQFSNIWIGMVYSLEESGKKFGYWVPVHKGHFAKKISKYAFYGKLLSKGLMFFLCRQRARTSFLMRRPGSRRRMFGWCTGEKDFTQCNLKDLIFSIFA